MKINIFLALEDLVSDMNSLEGISFEEEALKNRHKIHVIREKLPINLKEFLTLFVEDGAAHDFKRLKPNIIVIFAFY